jgi:predicted kinase
MKKTISNKKEMIILIGNIASGKTTLSKEYYRKGYLVVCADEIRNMLSVDNYIFDYELEDNVIHEATHSITENILKLNKDVVIDETMMKVKYRKAYIDLAKKYNYKVIGIVLADYGKEVHVERRMKDNARNCSAKLWSEVYERMSNNYEKPTLEEGFDELYFRVKQDKTLAKAIIVDLDGTLALFDNKNPYERDFINDRVHEGIKTLLLAYYNSYCGAIILLSGRNDKFKAETIEWLNKNNIPFTELHMRKNGDFRKDTIVKQEMFDEFVRNKYDVEFVLDDRNCVVQLWRSLGLNCFQVAEGNF